MTEQYDELLTRLKERSESNHVEIFVPSANETMLFKPLSVKQQADIISGVMKASQSNNVYSYQNTIDEIILSNSPVDADSVLMSFDRPFILLQYRCMTMGETMEIEGEQHNLNDHIDSVKTHEIDIDIFSKTLSHEGIVVHCAASTLQDEYKINKSVSDVFKNTTDKEQVSNIFKIELAKYIQKVSFDEHVLEFSTLTLKQKTQICDMLPMTLSQQIVQFVEKLREQESFYTTISVEDGLIDIPIDSQLFDR